MIFSTYRLFRLTARPYVAKTKRKWRFWAQIHTYRMSRSAKIKTSPETSSKIGVSPSHHIRPDPLKSRPRAKHPQKSARPPRTTYVQIHSNQDLARDILKNRNLPPPAELSNPGALVGLHGHGGVRGAQVLHDGPARLVQATTKYTG